MRLSSTTNPENNNTINNNDTAANSSGSTFRWLLAGFIIVLIFTIIQLTDTNNGSNSSESGDEFSGGTGQSYLAAGRRSKSDDVSSEGVDVVPWRHHKRTRPSWLGAPKVNAGPDEHLTTTDRRRRRLTRAFFGDTYQTTTNNDVDDPIYNDGYDGGDSFDDVESVDLFHSVQMLSDEMRKGKTKNNGNEKLLFGGGGAIYDKIVKLDGKARKIVESVYFAVKKMTVGGSSSDNDDDSQESAADEEESTHRHDDGVDHAFHNTEKKKKKKKNKPESTPTSTGAPGVPLKELGVAVIMDDWIPCNVLRRFVASASNSVQRRREHHREDSAHSSSSGDPVIHFLFVLPETNMSTATCTPTLLGQTPRQAKNKGKVTTFVTIEYSSSSVYVVRLSKALRKLTETSSAATSSSSSGAEKEKQKEKEHNEEQDISRISHILTLKISRGVDTSSVFASIGELFYPPSTTATTEDDENDGKEKNSITSSSLFSCLQLQYGKPVVGLRTKGQDDKLGVPAASALNAKLQQQQQQQHAIINKRKKPKHASILDDDDDGLSPPKRDDVGEEEGDVVGKQQQHRMMSEEELMLQQLHFKRKEYLNLQRKTSQDEQQEEQGGTNNKRESIGDRGPGAKRRADLTPEHIRRGEGLNVHVPEDAEISADDDVAVLLETQNPAAASNIKNKLTVLGSGYEMIIEIRDSTRSFRFQRRAEGVDADDSRADAIPTTATTAFVSPECFLATTQAIVGAGYPDQFYKAQDKLVQNMTFNEHADEWTPVPTTMPPTAAPPPTQQDVNNIKVEGDDDDDSQQLHDAPPPITEELVQIAYERLAQRVRILEQLIIQVTIHHIYASGHPKKFHELLLDCRKWIGEAVGLFNAHNRVPFYRYNTDENGFDVNYFANEPEVAFMAISRALSKLKLATISVWKTSLFHASRHDPHRIDAESTIEYSLMLSLYGFSRPLRLLTTITNMKDRSLAALSSSIAAMKAKTAATSKQVAKKTQSNQRQFPPPKLLSGANTLAMINPFEANGDLRLAGMLASRSEQFLANRVFNTSKPLIAWFSLCCWCCGFSNEIVHYLIPLQQEYQTMLISDPGCFCNGFPKFVERIINTTMTTPSTFTTADRVSKGQAPVIWISHTTPLHYWHDIFRVKKPDYLVGRSMFEFNRIPKSWLNYISLANEVWVPSQFVYDSFVRSGVARSKLVFMPEALDTSLYAPLEVVQHLERNPHHKKHRSPEMTEAIDALKRGSHGGGGAVESKKTTTTTRRTVRSTVFSLPPGLDELNGVGRRNTDFFASNINDVKEVVDNYKFLSIFKWEDRKGWDVLLTAYFKEFTRADKVSLYIVTTIFHMKGQKFESARDADAVIRWTNAFAMKMGRDVDDLPHVYIITAPMGEVDIAAIYRSADAFVLPTRGEGWGLPTIQAMSSGLPAISTNYSGNVDFMREDCSFLIKVDGLEPIPSDIGVLDSDSTMQWANPSPKHTAQLMRNLVNNPELGREYGRRARAFIEEHYSEEAIYREWLKPRLEKIEELIHAAAVSKQQGE